MTHTTTVKTHQCKEGPLRSMDIFSGIGGISLALKGICKPILYCDICKTSQSVLSRRMDQGLLPRAPIISDVRQVTKELVSHKGTVDIIVGGFPCQGFSNMGKKTGLEHQQSKLYREIIRIIDEFHPHALFLENVPGVIKSMFSVLQTDLCSRGFVFAWTVVNASFVGAHHDRARWFCLAFKPKTFRFSFKSCLSYNKYNWSNEPQRTCNPTDASDNNARMRMLGNSVVPDAVRFAFFALASAFTHRDITSSSLEFTLPLHIKSYINQAKIPAVNPKTISSHGFCLSQNEFYNYTPVRNVYRQLRKQRPVKSLSLNPEHNLDNSNETNIPINNHVKTIVKMSRWSTPRYGNILPSRCLTIRGLRDLPNQIRFERKTKNRYDPINSEFIEFLMGYPLGWTHYK